MGIEPSRRRWRLPRVRFSLMTLMLGVLLVSSGYGLWFRWEPWVLSNRIKTDIQHLPEGITAGMDAKVHAPDGRRVFELRGKTIKGFIIHMPFIAVVDGGQLLYGFPEYILSLNPIGFLDDDTFAFGNVIVYEGDQKNVPSKTEIAIYHRRRPEWWWGVAWLPEFWLTILFAGALVWSVRRDRRTLPRA